MQDDDGAPRWIEPPQGVLDHFALHDVGPDIAGDRAADRRQFHLDRTAPSPAQKVDAGSDEQPMQPGVEALGIAKSGQVPPGVQQRVLDRVSRELAVPEDQSGRSVQPRDGRASEHGEGVMIASLCLLDETPLVHCCL